MGLCDERFFPRTNTCTSQLIPFPFHILEDSQQQQSVRSALQGFFLSPISTDSVSYATKVRERQKEGEEQYREWQQGVHLGWQTTASKEEPTVIKILRYTEKF